MVVPLEVQQFIDRKYPKPHVDRDWLQQCYAWALDQDGIGPVPPYSQELLELLEDQLLKSSLVDSMNTATGLPEDLSDVRTRTELSGEPTLVEIISLTEIGHSAFQLDQVRKGREERIKAGLDEYGEGDEEADLEVEGEGPMPKYPRGVLSFVLSDGKTSFKAFEYKPLPELSLVKTPLGFKLQLKKVRVVCGVAQLEPDNVVLLGGQSELHRYKDYYFRQDLRQRMGHPLEPLPQDDDQEDPNDEDGAAQPPPPQGGAPPNVRSPLREISPPPSPPLLSRRNDDEDLEPQHRRVPRTSSTLLPNVSRSRLATTSAYFAQSNSNGPSSNLTMALSPTLRQTAPTLPSESPPMSDVDFDFNMLDEIERQALDKLPPSPPPAASGATLAPIAPSSKPGASQGSRNKAGTSAGLDSLTLLETTSNVTPTAFPSIFSAAPRLDAELELAPDFLDYARNIAVQHKDEDDFYDFFDTDDDLGSEDMRALDTAERQGLASHRAPAPAPVASTSATPASSSSNRRSQPPSRRVQSRQTPVAEVITISDDDMQVEAGDKENLPVPRRHTRPRVERNHPSVRSGEMSSQRNGSGGQTTNSQSNRPVNKAPTPMSVIDISDSDSDA